jgi:pullulanase
MHRKYGEFPLRWIIIKFFDIAGEGSMYNGDDLGANCFGEYTVFKVWAPTAKHLKVVIYNEYFDEYGNEYNMAKDESGVWELTLKGDYKNKYYNYKVTINESERETPDPYAKGSSLNGNRGMVVNFKSINPEGWECHSIPPPIKPTEAIIYEVHVRDFSIDTNSGMLFKGKYLAFTEEGTKGTGDVSTGIDHLKELGITHIHLLPVFDFKSVDERLDKKYNWGYDPYLYNVPEGSYATNPYDGIVRIVEFKQMIKKLHENDIRVVMDVVFNHTSDTEDSPFNILVPKYYYRMNKDGSYSNGSGCGNEIASEKPMVRKFIIDCVKFWAEEYKIDGFRFDLMALMDIETMTEIIRQLNAINPNILIYGEPWTGGNSVLNYELQFKKGCQRGMPLGVFNDDFRNAIKGDNDGDGLGFVNGAYGLEHEIKKGIVGSIHYNDFFYGFAKEPCEAINYVSSHDNLTLFDKIKKVSCDATDLERELMNRLALSILLTSQGVVFIHGGAEILRSKQDNPNSYCAGDEVNKIQWDNKNKYIKTFRYIKCLIELRKSQKIMTMDSSEDIIKNLHFIDSPQNTVAYLLNTCCENDFKQIFIIHNANKQEIIMSPPGSGVWQVIANGWEINLRGLNGDKVTADSKMKVPPLSTYILAR